MSHRKLFLLDFSGALLSATLHFLVLAPMEYIFGMPAIAVYTLGGLAYYEYKKSIQIEPTT
ncbi:MAG: hypothetical protein AAF741_13900 [Bacteroidota bacterium]